MRLGQLIRTQTVFLAILVGGSLFVTIFNSLSGSVGFINKATLASEKESTQPSGELHPHRIPSTWLDVNGEPLPFQSEDEILKFLLKGEGVSRQIMGEGINEIPKVVLENDGIRAHIAWRTVDVSRKQQRLSDGSIQLNFRDCGLFEVAAYRLSRMLGLTNVPPAVKRKAQGKTGSVQLWVENAVTRKSLHSQPPRPVVWLYQYQTMYLFDSLLRNVDRNQGNILIDKGWKLWMIDHTQAFQIGEARNLEAIHYCDREVYKRLKGLDEKVLREEMKGLLKPLEMRSLLKRRDRIISHIESLVTAKGERAVLF